MLVGLLSGEPADREHASRNERGVRVESVYVGSVKHFEQMNEAIARSGIQPVIDRVFPFESAPAAFRHLESGTHLGEVVIGI